MLHTTLRFLLL